MNMNLNFRKVRHCLGKSLRFFYENHLFPAKNVNFCEFCKKDACFQKGGVIFANSAKMAHVSHGYNLEIRNSCFSADVVFPRFPDDADRSVSSS